MSISFQGTEVPVDVFKYTEGNALNFDGEDYIGYYTVAGNRVYRGRVIDSSSPILTAVDNSRGNFIIERSFFNRGTYDDMELTNDLEQLRFQPSEFINQNSINTKLTKLYENFLDLYNYSFVRNSNLPFNYTGFIGVTGNTPTEYLNYTTDLNSTYTDTSEVNLTDARGFELIGNFNTSSNPLKVETPGSFASIYFTTSALQIFINQNDPDTGSTATFILSTDRADGIFSQPFQNITDITTNDMDTLYVSDTFHNQIYRLYIDPVINNKNPGSSSFDLLNAGGFKLNTSGQSTLSGVSHMYYFNDEIYTWNEGRKSVIVLGDNLSKIREYNNIVFKEKQVQDFAVNPITGVLFIVFDDFTILEVDSLFKTASILHAPDVSRSDPGTPTRILFSQNDSNIYYIITDTNVFKFLIYDGTDELIGSFNFTDLPGVDFTTSRRIFDAKILAENENRDSLFIFNKDIVKVGDEYRGRDRLMRFSEPNNLLNLLEDANFKIYDREDISVKEQYFNNITFNKSLQKLLYNHDNLAANIQFQFNLAYSTEKLLTLTGISSLSASVVQASTYDNFVGMNEVLTPQVFNRCIERIYNYQLSIMKCLEFNVTNLKYPYSEIVPF
tara:strand:+ start:1445 stop:3283 length:1839 start_codon:yes stop_codon:yes gene_type:complete